MERRTDGLVACQSGIQQTSWWPTRHGYPPARFTVFISEEFVSSSAMLVVRSPIWLNSPTPNPGTTPSTAKTRQLTPWRPRRLYSCVSWSSHYPLLLLVPSMLDRTTTPPTDRRKSVSEGEYHLHGQYSVSVWSSECIASTVRELIVARTPRQCTNFT